MVNMRWATLAVIVVAVLVLVSVSLAAAEEGQPPVQPLEVELQADDVLWDQLAPVKDAGASAQSYVMSTGFALAADDFVITGSHTAGFVSKVVVRAAVDAFFPGSEKASICLYGNVGGDAPSAIASSCYTNLSDSGRTAETSGFGYLYYVLTYTIPASPFLLVDTRYWVSVQLSGPLLQSWYWRGRDAPNNPYAGSRPFAFQRSSGFPGSGFSSDACKDKWQVQTTTSNCSGISTWPAGTDLSFRLVGSYFDGELTNVYLPLVRR